MKTKWTLRRITNVIAITLTISMAAYFIYSTFLAKHTVDVHNINGIDVTISSNIPDNLKPIDATIPDTLGYKKYNQLADSVRVIRRLKNGEHFSGGGVNFGSICTTASVYCDTCNLKWYYKSGFE